MQIEGVQGQPYLYHDPCHSPMKQQDPLKTVSSLLGGAGVNKSDRCCGESGTLAVSRSDISNQVRFRKAEELVADVAKLRDDNKTPVKLLTSCPSCLQGLQRYQGDVEKLEVDYIVVEMARHLLGKKWLEQYVKQARQGGIERVLL